MELLILVVELAGTMAFAASGAMTGMQKNMDIFGICILALTTAVGGGVTRDLILGNTPPATFRNPIYATVAIVTALVLFLPWVRHFLMRDPLLYERSMLILDTFGLGIFTVMGMRIAYETTPSPTLFLLVFVGVVTGVGGGVIRDMMAGDTPYIFVRHIYACASLAGALVCAALWGRLGELPAMLIGMAVVIFIRLLSAHYHWNLPKAHD